MPAHVLEKHSFCPGCNKAFSHSGLSRHLATSPDPRCIRVRQDLGTFGSSEHEESGDEVHGLGNPSHFRGDFFGDDYKLEDFGWEEESEDGDYSPGHSSEEDEDDYASSSDGEKGPSNIDDEGGVPWEPPVDPQQENPHPGPGNRNDIEMEEGEGQQARNEAEQETRRRPVIVPFSKGKAGQVLYQTNNQYMGYQKGLGGDAQSIYAPFASEMDWEFAKWAKLRGPGSTSVSELLQIKGVRAI